MTEDHSLCTDITTNIEGGSAVTAVNEIIGSYDVLLFSKSSCPFCFEMKRMLQSYGVSYALFEIDLVSDTEDIQEQVKELSGFSTVPNLFIKGESFGGCTDNKDKELNGRFQAKLAPFVTAKPNGSNKEVTQLGLFWFPDTVDGNVVRVTSLLSCICCIFLVGYWDRPATKWVSLALAMDYLIRVLYGASYSLGGAVAMLLLSRSDPVWSAGPPKQFAACCGLFMSTFAAALHVSGEREGGTVLLAGLIFAAGLEGVFNFCLGCWIFGHLIRLGLVSPLVYSPYLALSPLRKWNYNFRNNTDEAFPVAENEHVLMPWQDAPTPVDLIRKNRIETEYKDRDFDLIRHARIDLFAIPMTGAALAFMLKIGDDDRFNTDKAYKTMGIVSSVIFVSLGVLYMQKLVFYTKKVVKEWHHPTFGNLFSTISICITLFGILLLGQTDNGAGAMIWIGSVLQMLITVFRVSDLVYNYISEEMINPTLMMAPVGNLLSAVGFAQYDVIYSGPNMHGKMNYLFMSRLWFGVGALFGLVLFIITFRRALHDHHVDTRNRPTLWIWLATSSIAGPAFVSVAGYSSTDGTGVLFQSLWCISLVLFVVNGLGFVKNFYSYVPDSSVWNIPFAMCAFAASTIQYDIFVKDELFYVLSIITMSIAAAVTAIVTTLTLTRASDLSLFMPRPKWGPVSFMKITHECFRFAIPKYRALLAGLEGAHPLAVAQVVQDLDQLFAVFNEHSRHEDQILFPRMRRFFPGMNLAADAEHCAVHDACDVMAKALSEFNSSAKDADACAVLISLLTAKLPEWEEQVLPHLRNEESTFTVVARKYIPLDLQIKIAQDAFDCTDGNEWRKVMSFLMKNLPSVEWKVTYLKTFIWANPARAQEVGLMVYHGVDSITWLVLSRALPEIIPRGLPGHKRIY